MERGLRSSTSQSIHFNFFNKGGIIILNPKNYTVEEAEFLFRCELDQLQKHALISTQRHNELLSSHQCFLNINSYLKHNLNKRLCFKKVLILT